MNSSALCSYDFYFLWRRLSVWLLLLLFAVVSREVSSRSLHLIWKFWYPHNLTVIRFTDFVFVSRVVLPFHALRVHQVHWKSPSASVFLGFSCRFSAKQRLLLEK